MLSNYNVYMFKMKFLKEFALSLCKVRGCPLRMFEVEKGIIQEQMNGDKV